METHSLDCHTHAPGGARCTHSSAVVSDACSEHVSEHVPVSLHVTQPTAGRLLTTANQQSASSALPSDCSPVRSRIRYPDGFKATVVWDSPTQSQGTDPGTGQR